MKYLKILGVIFAGSLSTCTKDTTQDEVFYHLGHQVIVPTLAEFVEHSQTLVGSMESLCAQPTNDHLDVAQQAWKNAYEPWVRSEAFAFGPAAQLGVKNRINFWPTRVDTLEATLAGIDNPDTNTIEQVGASAKGLSSLEYLLFDDEFNDSTVLAKLAEPTTGANRCAYAYALAQNLEQQASALHQEWVRMPDGFLHEFVSAGQGTGTYPRTQDAIDILVNTIVAHLTFVVMNKLEKPMDAAANGENGNESLESRFSDGALADLRANLLGVAAIYRGHSSSSNPVGLSTLVRAADPDLDERIQAQIDLSLTSIEKFSLPLRLALVEDPARVESLHRTIDDLRRLFKLEVVSALSVTLTLTDNDGD